MSKTYNESTIVIVINFAQEDSCKVDLSSLGNFGNIDYACTSAKQKATLKKNVVELPGWGIAVISE